jgi:hypothetical protein
LPTARAVGRDCGGAVNEAQPAGGWGCQRRRPSAGIVACASASRPASPCCGCCQRRRPSAGIVAARATGGPCAGRRGCQRRKPSAGIVARGSGARPRGRLVVANGAGRRPGLWLRASSGVGAKSSGCQRRRPSAGIVAGAPGSGPAVRGTLLPTAQAVSRDCGVYGQSLFGGLPGLPTAQAVSRDCGLYDPDTMPPRLVLPTAQAVSRDCGAWAVVRASGAAMLKLPTAQAVSRDCGVGVAQADAAAAVVANGAGRQPGLWPTRSRFRPGGSACCQRRRPSAGIVAPVAGNVASIDVVVGVCDRPLRGRRFRRSEGQFWMSQIVENIVSIDTANDPRGFRATGAFAAAPDVSWGVGPCRMRA